MKIVLKDQEDVIKPFTNTKNLIKCLYRYCDQVVRVELTSKEFSTMLFDINDYDPVGIDAGAPEDYSGRYVLLEDEWCIQTHSDYKE